ncbi:DUF2339 domain-containing protein [Gaetbulibacter sp. M235]|uniref:DUF2339 domain-containing protein n=1 Tax=Gaetbulibacter sp. M235 TaxID=3126510 RepID=UPI00374EE5BF
MDNQNKVDELQKRLDLLLKKQEVFSKEINDLQKELNLFKISEKQQEIEKAPVVEKTSFKEKAESVTETHKGFFRDVYHRGLGGVCSGLGNYLGINRYLVRFLWILLSLFFGIGFFLYLILWIAVPKIKKEATSEKSIQTITKEAPKQVQTVTPAQNPIKISNELEKFIGENLINKIGIAILIIGVAIGAKYSIENDLISPLTRIILGYLVGLGLLGLSIKLKPKFENFSAVLVSGAMAILYFLTYAAYSYYGLIPQIITFVLMFVFTGFTVFAALKYNKQLIAHIGLVGAYAVPFLLSDGSGNATVLFSYMSIINIGILVLAFYKYWKPLNYVSFVLTWLIYLSWFTINYNSINDFATALIFAGVFFVIFYATFLAYKLIKKEQFDTLDVILILANSFIFYGFGYTILENHETGNQLLGLFTLCNAILHFIVSVIIYRLKLADKNLFYLVVGLVLVFITITIPVQLDGNWVTLLWTGEAAFLFWIGRTKSISVYEYISYPLMALAIISLYEDWSNGYLSYWNISDSNKIMPLLNIYFLTTILVVVAFGFIYFINKNSAFISEEHSKKDNQKTISFAVPAIIISTVYIGLFLEIDYYFQRLYNESQLTINNQEYFENYNNYSLLKFKVVWLLIYSMVFVSAMSFFNIKKLKNKTFGYINIGLNGITVFFFLTLGLYALSELRDNYLNQNLSEYYHIGTWYIAIRYVSYVFVAVTLFVSYKYVLEEFMKITNKVPFSILFYFIILWIASSELVNLLDMSGSTQSYKLGLSILWGVFSLLLIALGIWKQRKHLRIAAIVLFSITLIKLFFYDISHLGTISKTIVFVSLGILLLIISFLYNKFKSNISDDI